MQCTVCNKEISPADSYCPQCGKQVDAAIMSATTTQAATPSNLSNAADNMLLADVNRRLSELEKKIPNTRILAQGFWTRSWAVFGHTLVPTIFIYAVMFILMLILSLVLVHTLLPQYKSYL
jgi:hypothetical protein